MTRTLRTMRASIIATVLSLLIAARADALTAVVVYSYLRHSLIERERAELIASSKVFTRQLNLISQNVASEVHVLSLDCALRKVIAERDRGTEMSALRNHGNRVGATRMGLPFAKAIVELHGGSLAFESAPNKGMTVNINLPLLVELRADAA